MSADFLEIEQKYEADEGFELPPLAGVLDTSMSGPVRYELTATYFDTDDLVLNEHRITLRRRTGGEDAGWHLKLPVSGDTRRESHAPLGEADQGVPDRLAAQLTDIAADRALRPIAILRTDRTVLRLTDPEGPLAAEVSDDYVTAQRLGPAGPSGSALAWREIEVEAGDAAKPGLLAALGEMLLAAGARRSATSSKLSRLLSRD